MFTLGVNLSHHSSIALLDDNKVVLFVLEERLNRIKHCKTIPTEALKLVCDFTDKVDTVVVSAGSEEDLRTIVQHLKECNVSVSKATTNNPAHHLYHAAAGFYMSHFDEASCLVIDGAGSMRTFRQKDKIKASETTSVFEVSFPDVFECTYKNYTIGIYDSNFNFNDDLSVSIDVTDEEVESFKSKVQKVQRVEASTNTDIGFKYTIVSHQIGFPKMGGEGKTMGLSAYGPISSDPNTKKAYDIQKELESTFIERARLCKNDNIVLSGGCALNILGNSLIKKTFPNKNIYIDPVAADGTIALGAAAHFFFTKNKCRDKLIFNPYGGPHYNINKNYIHALTRKYSI